MRKGYRGKSIFKGDLYPAIRLERDFLEAFRLGFGQRQIFRTGRVNGSNEHRVRSIVCVDEFSARFVPVFRRHIEGGYVFG